MKKSLAYAFKHRVLHLLQKDGFSVAPVADSEYPVDLLAIRNGETRDYRCKAHGKIYDKEIQRLRKFAHALKIKVFIAKENAAREIVIRNVEAYS